MILTKIYEEFVETTSLRDGLYKTVFSRIWEVLDKIKDIKWIKLKYTIDDKEYITDFTTTRTVPLYIVEIIQNLIDKSYSFPENSTVFLDVEYKGIPYIIKCINDKILIPEELEFIREMNIFRFFLVTKKVFDVFSEFDDIFSFVNNFKTKINSVYIPLQKQFDKKLAKERIDLGEISTEKVASTQSLVENLKNSRKDVLSNIESLRESKERLISDKNNISKAVRSRRGLEAERDSLKLEHESLKEIYTDYKTKFDKTVDLISEVDVELEGLVYLKTNNSNEYNEEFHNFLLDRKELIVKDKNLLISMATDTKGLMDSISVRLISLGNMIRKIENYSEADIISLTDKIEEKEKKLNDSFIALTSMDNEIKHQTSKSISERIEVESTRTEKNMHTYSVGIDDIEKKDITDHLFTSLQPTSVTVVMNYLRYYFAYHTTKIAAGLVDTYPKLDSSILQAIACKLVLAKNFGISYSNIFSYVNFVDSRIDKLILIKD
jgi:hypothetical protein